MSCNSYTLSGLVQNCESSKGGIKKVYVATSDPKPIISQEIITDWGAEVEWYEYNIKKNTSSMTSTLNIDPSNGVNFVSTDLILQFNKMDTTKRIEMKGLSVNDMWVCVLDSNDKLWYLGYDEAVNASAGSGQTGTAKSDGNFYQITLSNDSKILPYEVDKNALKIKDYIDLGLPSGLLWAKCNLGANKPEEYGKYFQWGDISGVYDASKSTWQTCPFNDGESSFNDEYFNAHMSEWMDNGVLKSKYDAASQLMDEGWRMPTKDDFDELIINTTAEVVDGGLILHSIHNGNSLFIPFAGSANDGSMTGQNANGSLWSSSLYSAKNRAYCLYLTNASTIGVYGENRKFGYSIRGVRAK